LRGDVSNPVRLGILLEAIDVAGRSMREGRIRGDLSAKLVGTLPLTNNP
jgi:hypothetical protein